jgi:hypothetical protein
MGIPAVRIYPEDLYDFPYPEFESRNQVISRYSVRLRRTAFAGVTTQETFYEIIKFEMLLNKKRYIIEISPINHGQGFCVEGKPNHNIGGANNGFF